MELTTHPNSDTSRASIHVSTVTVEVLWTFSPFVGQGVSVTSTHKLLLTLPSSLYLILVNTNFGSYHHSCTWVWSTRTLDPTVILVPGFGQYELWILPSSLYLGLVNMNFGSYRHPCTWVWSIRTLDPTIILVLGFAQHDLWILSSSLYLGLVKTKSGSPRTTDFPRARVTMPCAPSGQSPWGDLQRPPSLLPLPLSTLGCVTARPLAGAVWEVSLVRSWASRGHLLALSPDSNRRTYSHRRHGVQTNLEDWSMGLDRVETSVPDPPGLANSYFVSLKFHRSKRTWRFSPPEGSTDNSLAVLALAFGAHTPVLEVGLHAMATVAVGPPRRKQRVFTRETLYLRLQEDACPSGWAETPTISLTHLQGFG
ncbi:hypothetical protein RRG08_027423 [Elysia crispata]|uniref:Uncharacterized protein n=1 Tax=Elysia crispata TaxID=231223 RepID=A0AAE0YFW7_9GAST|nr:hypothetical protein RRG08_027423 [Elysia crispata]